MLVAAKVVVSHVPKADTQAVLAPESSCPRNGGTAKKASAKIIGITPKLDQC